MFQKHDDDGYKTPIPGVDMKTLVYGAKTLMTKFLLQKGSSIPSHAHPHEQTGYLVKGKMRFIIGSDEFASTMCRSSSNCPLRSEFNKKGSITP